MYPDRYQRQHRDYRRRLGLTARRFDLMRLYGMTLDDYLLLLDAQEGRCKICGEPPLEGKVLSVDHDHETGKVRGLLCMRCNSGLGYLRDRVDLLKAAIAYLEVL